MALGLAFALWLEPDASSVSWATGLPPGATARCDPATIAVPQAVLPEYLPVRSSRAGVFSSQNAPLVVSAQLDVLAMEPPGGPRTETLVVTVGLLPLNDGVHLADTYGQSDPQALYTAPAGCRILTPLIGLRDSAMYVDLDRPFDAFLLPAGNPDPDRRFVNGFLLLGIGGRRDHPGMGVRVVTEKFDISLTAGAESSATAPSRGGSATGCHLCAIPT